MALPSPIATIPPNNTVATLELLVLYFKLPASEGFKVALITEISNGFIFRVVFATLISVGIFSDSPRVPLSSAPGIPFSLEDIVNISLAPKLLVSPVV